MFIQLNSKQAKVIIVEPLEKVGRLEKLLASFKMNKKLVLTTKEGNITVVCLRAKDKRCTFLFKKSPHVELSNQSMEAEYRPAPWFANKPVDLEFKNAAGEIFTFKLSEHSMTAKLGQFQKESTPIASEKKFRPHNYLLAYFGRTVSNDLQEIIFGIKHDHEDAHIYAGEIGRAWFTWLVFQFETAINFTRHTENTRGGHRDFNSYNTFFSLRYTPPFSWNEYTGLSLMVGEGISYAEKIPESEILKAERKRRTKTHRFLNFLTFEVATKPAPFKKWSAFLRIHHRSGAYGTYNNVTGGSNIICGGLKFQFR